MATLTERLRDSTIKQIAVMQAFVDGKTILVQLSDTKAADQWFPLATPSWDWVHFNYKVQE